MESIREDRLEAIFKKQQKLMDEYHEIEEENGLLYTDSVPVDLDSRFGQARIKDFAWRVTEELGEAIDAVIQYDTPHPCNEEISDALHFLTEMTILAGYEPQDLGIYPSDNMDNLSKLYRGAKRQIMEKPDTIHEFIKDINSCHLRTKKLLTYSTGRIIESMGVLCNYLKNRPWKQSYQKTDKERFETELRRVWHRFIELCLAANISGQGLMEMYFDKNEINQQRIEDDY